MGKKFWNNFSIEIEVSPRQMIVHDLQLTFIISANDLFAIGVLSSLIWCAYSWTPIFSNVNIPNSLSNYNFPEMWYLVFRPTAALFCTHWEIQNLVFMFLFPFFFYHGFYFSTTKKLLAFTMCKIQSFCANVLIFIYQSVEPFFS